MENKYPGGGHDRELAVCATLFIVLGLSSNLAAVLLELYNLVVTC